MQYQQVHDDYNQIQEQYSMLLEDLNAKLIERELLINQREDIELVLEKEDPLFIQHAIQSQSLQQNQIHIINTIQQQNQQINQLQFERFQLESQFNEDKEYAAQLYLQNTKKLQQAYERVCFEKKKLNQIINSTEVQWEQIQQKAINNAHIAFTEYYYNQLETFRNIKKSYGEEEYYKIIKEHQEELQNLIMSDYQQRIENIKQLTIQQEQLQKQQQKNIECVQCHLQVEIQSVQKQMNLKKDLLAHFRRYNIQSKDQTQMDQQKEYYQDESKCSSQTKNRSYSGINYQKRKGNFSCQNDDTQLILNQISFDDSLIQNLQDMGECDKSINMPLQRLTQDTQQSVGEDYLKVQTITEEKQSSNKNRQILKPLFNFTLSNPSTNKANKNYLQMKENIFNSDQCNKTDFRSKSLEQTQKKSFTRKQSIQGQQNSEQQQNQKQKRQVDQEMLERINPIVQGIDLYKRFSTGTQFKRQEYNSRLNPQQCGYGFRKMHLSKKLDKIEFRNYLKPQVVEQSIKTSEILRVLLNRQQNDELKQGRIELLINREIAQEWQKLIILVKENCKSLIQLGKQLEQQ